MEGDSPGQPRSVPMSADPWTLASCRLSTTLEGQRPSTNHVGDFMDDVKINGLPFTVVDPATVSQEGELELITPMGPEPITMPFVEAGEEEQAEGWDFVSRDGS